jgi:EmrB/QacA subfamily drug resistance transporter
VTMPAKRSLPIFRDRRGAALAVICLSTFIISVDATIVNVALPTLSRALAATTTDLQWFTDAYILVLSGLLLAAGSLSDRYGRRGWLCLGLIVFAITSVVASQVMSAGALIMARAAMGVGAAVVFPTTLSLITNMFTARAQRAKVIGLWAAMTGLGIAVGPTSGGWLVEHFWWGSIFLVNVPVAIAAVIGALLFVPTSRDPATPPVDVVGLLLSAVGLILLVYTIIEAPTVGWGAGRSVTGFASSALILLMFGWWESRSTHPMLDLSVFRNRRFAGSSLAVTAAYVGIFGFIFLTTQYFQFLKDYTAFGTGARMLPVAVALAVSGVVAPRLVEWVGTTSVVVFGLLMLAAGMAGGALFAVSTPYPQIAIVMVLIGGGMGFTSAPATEAIMGSLSADKAGVGSAVNESSRELGAALGVAVVGSVFASIYTARLADYTAITSLPTAGRSKIGESIAAAQRVIGQLPSTQSANVKLAVDDAFLDGMGTGSLVCAAIALAAAAIVAVLLPAHAGADDRELTADMPGVSQKHVPDNSSR